jgi:hypothetical protein
MTIDYAGHFQPKIVDIHYADADLAHAGPVTQWITDAKSSVCSRLYRLTDDTVHRAAIYVAGWLVADGVVLGVRNLGFQHHTWWGWLLFLLIGISLTWMAFLGLVALTFAVLSDVVGALRSSLSRTPRTRARTRAAAPVCLVAQPGAVVNLVGPGAVGPHQVRLSQRIFE